MAISVAVEPYGTAFDALAESVRSAKGPDLLGPVTVVVARAAVGLAARRRLAATAPGSANVRFVTWGRLGLDLAARRLSAGGWRPATPALVRQAVRLAVAEAPEGLFSATPDQPATIRALARTLGELAGVAPATLAALGAQSPRAAEVVALVDAVRARLAGHYDSAELLAVAAAEVRADPAPAIALGPVVVYLPGRLGPAELGLLDALADRTPVRVVVGATGDRTADAPARELVRRWDVGADRRRGFDVAPPWGSAVRVAPSADAEVLLALRHLLQRHAEGMPLERMALLHGGAPPYPRLVRDLAAGAGIPVHGAGTRPLAATVPGRILLGALSLPDRDWRRDDVVAWVASGPLVVAGRGVPAATWDVLSCQAGVVAGLEQWRTRLATHAHRLRAQAAGTDGATPAQQANACEDLWQFVEAAAARLAGAPNTWEGWRRWGSALLADLLGGPALRGAWPAEQVLALDAVSAVLADLAGLDELGGGPPALSDFRAAVTAELEAAAPETARFGRGILVGGPAEAVGLDLDVVWVLGMVDGAFPATPADDVLLPDRQREQAGGSIPLRSAQPADSRRAYLGALGGARERVLSFPAADQRRGRELRPARWLLDTVGHLAGDGRRYDARHLRAADLPLPADTFDAVGSYALAVAGGGEPVSASDWALRSMTRWRSGHRGLAGHPLVRRDPVLAAALATRRGRASTSMTRYDGLVKDVPPPSPAGSVQSPTGLEAYARCPRRYLFDSVLEVAARQRPERVLRISPADRGTLVHRVLERLVAGELAGGPPAADVEHRLQTVVADVFADAERRGATGHPALWRLDRAAILGDLRQFVRDDARYRARTGAAPVAVEERFGSEGCPDLEVGLGGGRVVRFGGRIDRVDALPGGGVAVVDYKTGRMADEHLDQDPVAGGTRLQLAVYALAARGRHRTGGPVDAGYWYVGREPEPVGLTVGPEAEERLADVVGSIVRGVEAGWFPANPGPTDHEGGVGSHCAGCPFDRMCPTDRVAAWRRKQADPSEAGSVAAAGAT